MFSKTLLRLSSLLVIALALQMSQQGAHSAPLEKFKDAAKSLVEKAADAADKVEPTKEEGGKASIFHAGANIVFDKTIEAIGKRYPAIEAAAPIVKKISKPMINSIHRKFNKIGQKKVEETPAEVKPAVEKKEEAKKSHEKVEKEKKSDAKKDKKEDGKKDEKKDEKKVEAKEELKKDKKSEKKKLEADVEKKSEEAPAETKVEQKSEAANKEAGEVTKQVEEPKEEELEPSKNSKKPKGRKKSG